MWVGYARLFGTKGTSILSIVEGLGSFTQYARCRKYLPSYFVINVLDVAGYASGEQACQLAVALHSLNNVQPVSLCCQMSCSTGSTTRTHCFLFQLAPTAQKP